MAVLTGNYGVAYMAQYATASALAGNYSLTSQVLGGTTLIKAGTSVYAVSVTGNGSGAQGQLYSSYSGGAWSGDIAAGTVGTNRSGNIKITTGGNNYEAGDIVKWQLSSTKADTTVNTTVSSVSTVGIDNSAELRTAVQKIARIRSWSLDIANDVVESTVLGDSSKRFIASTGTATGSATLMYYRDDGEGDSNNLDVGDIRNLIFGNSGPSKVIMALGVNASTSDDFVFNAFITGTSLAATYGEIVTVDINFQVDGAFIEYPAA